MRGRAAPLPSGEHRATRLDALYPYLLLALCQLSWAGNWVIGRAVREAMPPAALTFWRWTIAALCLAPFALPRLAGKGAVLRRHWRILLVFGLSGAGLFQAMVYTGLNYTETVNATLMNSASPLFILVMAWLMAVEPVSARQIAGMALSFCGILVIIARGVPGTLAAFHFNPGDLIILLGMPGWGLYCVLMPRKPAELGGPEFLFILSAVGALALLPFYAVESAFVRTPQWSWTGLAALLYVGVFASVMSYLLWNRGLELVGPNRAGVTNHLLPAFAAVLAVLLLGETVHLYHFIGIATILAGVWLATSARARA